MVYAPAERADTLLLFLLYPYVYSVVTSNGEDTARSKLYNKHDIYTGKNRRLTTLCFSDPAAAAFDRFPLRGFLQN